MTNDLMTNTRQNDPNCLFPSSFWLLSSFGLRHSSFPCVILCRFRQRDIAEDFVESPFLGAQLLHLPAIHRGHHVADEFAIAVFAAALAGIDTHPDFSILLLHKDRLAGNRDAGKPLG